MEKMVAHGVSAFIAGFGVWIIVMGLSSGSSAAWILAGFITVAIGLLSWRS